MDGHVPRIRLQDKDLIYFLHIPRTGGTSLYEVLAKKFPKEACFRGASRESLETTLRNASSETLEGFRLLSGPSEANVTKLVRRLPLFATMIREPIARTMSQFEVIKKTPHHRFHGDVTDGRMTFLDYLRHPEGAVLQANRQVRLIAGPRAEHSRETAGKIDRWALLELARERLEEFTFFGMQEHFDESIDLLVHTFHWKRPAKVPVSNATEARNHRLRLSSREIELASELNQLDLYLHEMARKLFHRRLAEIDATTATRGPGVAAAMHG